MVNYVSYFSATFSHIKPSTYNYSWAWTVTHGLRKSDYSNIEHYSNHNNLCRIPTGQMTPRLSRHFVTRSQDHWRNTILCPRPMHFLSDSKARREVTVVRLCKSQHSANIFWEFSLSHQMIQVPSLCPFQVLLGSLRLLQQHTLCAKSRTPCATKFFWLDFTSTGTFRVTTQYSRIQSRVRKTNNVQLQICHK